MNGVDMPELEIVEYRSSSTMDVRHAERIIDLIAAPYNETAEVFRRRQQRWVTESFVPGAFNGVAGDVTVNRVHDVERPIGKAVGFHPNDPRGLRTELRIAKTAEGNDVLELADEGLLGASVGFVVLPGGELWNTDRSVVKVTKARVAHIGLTGDPAYKGAQVLAVRSAEGAAVDAVVARVATPNLDRILLELKLDRR